MKSHIVPLKERLLRRINKNGPIPQHCPELGSCWKLKSRSKHPHKYIVVFTEPKKSDLAHRISWRIHRGEIPNGLLVLHKCDNRACVNPEHLFLGDYGDNFRDCIAKGRFNFRRGEQHPDTTISERTAKKIIMLRKKGLGPTAISKRMNLPYWTVYGIWSGTRWKHLPR